MKRKVEVSVNGKPMGEISLSDGRYSFDYDRGYVTNGGRMFRELSLPSETLFPIFSNAMAEGERRWFTEAFLRSNEPLDVLAEAFDAQNGFSFRFSGADEEAGVPFKRIPKSVSCAVGSDGVLVLPVNIPANHFKDIRGRTASGGGVKMSFSGVQDKFTAVLDEYGLRSVLPGERGNVLVKPNSNDYPLLPQNEFVFMTLNDEIFGESPFACLVGDPAREGIYHYVVERFDTGDEMWFEAAQLMGVSPEDKYESTLERLFDFMASSLRDADFHKFIDRCVFCYLSGNSDMHLKNFSLSAAERGHAKLSPAYDLVCSKMYGDGDRLALPLQGNKRPDVGTFAEWLSKWSDDIPERMGRVASHLSSRLDDMLDSVPGFDGKNVRWKERIRTNVLPMCERTLKAFGSPEQGGVPGM